VPAQWRTVGPHEVRWSVWTPKGAQVSRVEAGVVAMDSGSLTPAACVPDVAASTSSRQFGSCSLIARQGLQAARARAVNDSGASAWSEVQITFNRGSCTDAVAAAGACEEFDTGPGGGFVFYDAGSRQPWGQYLEAAPARWFDGEYDPAVKWCASNQPGYDVTLRTGEGIGSGAANTKVIVENCGTNNAAGVAAAYQGGGKTDWFLPSLDEMQKVYDRRGEIGSMSDSGYWSSSQNSGRTSWAMYFNLQDGSRATDGKSDGGHVRPIRAF